jgi:transcriptional regulator with XRE-family HTH domain
MRASRSNTVTRKQFAKLLKDYRERRRFTQEDAAKHMGVSVRTLQNWEIARNMPRGFGLIALVKALEKKKFG